MKKIIVGIAALSLALLSQASTVQFDLSPAGTDAASGLSPLNEVPGSTNSTGGGDEISAGISFNTDTSVLTVALGFGTAAGFTDLTGVATGIHIHGPAGPGTNGPVVVSLAPFLFTPADPALGGIVYGTVSIPTNEVSSLLAGLLYINVHTDSHPGGEIRGQLIPKLNTPPVVVAPAPSTVECGGPATVTAQVSDPEADALVAVWAVNGIPVQTNNIAEGASATPVAISFTAELPLGTNAVLLTVTDQDGLVTTGATTVTVVDTIPPVITRASATPDRLWPANHKMIPVRVIAAVSDVCGPATWKITSITSSEAVDARGSGNTAPDWQITGPNTAKLRAERSGITGPRIYTITIEAEDASGNVSQPKTITVTVPHDSRKK